MRMRSIAVFGLMAASLTLTPLADRRAQAQEPAARAGATAPSADPRDLSGVWYITNGARLDRDWTVHYGPATEPGALPHSRVLWTVDNLPPPFTPWGLEQFKIRFNAVVANQPIADPSTDCIPHGVPRAMVPNYPIQIVQTPKLTVMLFEIGHDVRLIHMNAVLPKAPKITQMGESVGHWEGDTLVVQTTGLSDSAILDEIGTPHSNKLVVTERIRKINGGKQLENLMTFNDPVAYTAPWTTREVFNWRSDMRLMEYVCEENNRNWSSANGETSVH